MTQLSPANLLQLAAIATLVLLCACAAAMRREQSWSFVTSVGGLALAAPVRVSQHWELPVRADVSGLQTITIAPTKLNSGLVCDETRAHVAGRDILIVIVTTLPHGNATSACPAADLGAIKPGQYDILYGVNRAEGIRLGSLDVPL